MFFVDFLVRAVIASFSFEVESVEGSFEAVFVE